MLQREIHFFLLVALWSLMGLSSEASVFLAPEADSTEYQNYLLRTHQQSFTKWSAEKISQRGVEAHVQVLEFSQRALKDGATKPLLQDWERLRLQLELNSTDREVLTLLAEKLNQTQELCRYILLDPDLLGILDNPEEAKECVHKGVPLPRSLKHQFEEPTGRTAQDLLVVDGVVLEAEQLPERLISGPYRWRVISNEFKEQSFQGTAYDFSKKPLLREPWVNGNCQKHTLDHPDFSVSLQSKIYFNNQCVVPGLPPEKNFRDWTREHKALLWGLGFIAAGLAAFQLKDKTLVITKP